VSQFEGISAEPVVWFGEQLEWLPATKAAELEGVRFHDLRHTAATLAVVAGATTKELIARMGHSTPDMAIRYQHIMKGRDAIVAASLDRLIQAGDGTEPGDTDMARRRRNQKERSRGRSPDQRGWPCPRQDTSQTREPPYASTRRSDKILGRVVHRQSSRSR
jgi:Phage integrase family